jgi:hypothetical protein
MNGIIQRGLSKEGKQETIEKRHEWILYDKEKKMDWRGITTSGWTLNSTSKR